MLVYLQGRGHWRSWRPPHVARVWRCQGLERLNLTCMRFANDYANVVRAIKESASLGMYGQLVREIKERFHVIRNCL